MIQRSLLKSIVCTSFLLALTVPLPAASLLDETFDADDGGFVPTDIGNPTGPWIHSGASGVWYVDGDGNLGTPSANYLTSPEVIVSAATRVQIQFEHRYSIEPEWDGLAVAVSVNGGPFEVVPNDAFTENGYTFSGLIGNHILSGGDGFNGDSAGYLDFDFITSTVIVGPYEVGDRLQVQFLGGWDEFAQGSLPNWEIDAVRIDTLEDSDGDGMDDLWEEDNDLIVGVDDSGEDPDMDTLTNLQEFERLTNPQSADTDNDDLDDNIESGTGIFVGPADTGSDPRNPDTDGDGIPDGSETGTGTFVSLGNTGSDPNKVDSDGDGVDDGVEALFGGDPADMNVSTGTFAVRHIDSAVQLANMATFVQLVTDPLPGDILDEVFEAAPVINYRDNADAHFGENRPFPLYGVEDANDDDYGIHVTGKIFIRQPGLRTFGVNSDDGNELYIDGVLVVTDPDPHGSRDAFGAIDLDAGEHTFELFFYERGGGSQIEVFVASELGDFTAYGDTQSWLLLPAYGSGLDDSDGDGLPDVWEQDNFGNLAQGAGDDPDNDELTNLAELQKATDPNNDDTDEDGLKDGVETDTGVFVDANDTGTSPKRDDTDGDGLLDGVETGTGIFVSASNTGSDPTTNDTDEDLVRDGVEVAAGTDPNDPNDFPNVPLLLGTGTGALVGGDLTDPENDGDPEFDAGYNAIFDSSEEQGFGGGEFAYNVFDNTLGPGNAKWCCGNNGFPYWVQATFESPIVLTSFTVSSANDTPARDPRVWEIQGSNDGVNFDTIFRQDDPGAAIWESRLEVRLFTAGMTYAVPAAYSTIRFICFETGLTSGAMFQVGEIEFFGETSVAPLAFTDVVYDPETEMVELEWQSRPGRSYTVSAGTGVDAFPVEIDDAVASQGETTRFGPFPNPLPGEPRVFFIARENPN